MTDFTYRVWQDPDLNGYGFDVSFVWGGKTYNMRGSEDSPTKCWKATCAFMWLVMAKDGSYAV